MNEESDPPPRTYKRRQLRLPDGGGVDKQSRSQLQSQTAIGAKVTTWIAAVDRQCGSGADGSGTPAVQHHSQQLTAGEDAPLCSCVATPTAPANNNATAIATAAGITAAAVRSSGPSLTSDRGGGQGDNREHGSAGAGSHRLPAYFSLRVSKHGYIHCKKALTQAFPEIAAAVLRGKGPQPVTLYCKVGAQELSFRGEMQQNVSRSRVRDGLHVQRIQNLIRALGLKSGDIVRLYSHPDGRAFVEPSVPDASMEGCHCWSVKLSKAGLKSDQILVQTTIVEAMLGRDVAQQSDLTIPVLPDPRDTTCMGSGPQGAVLRNMLSNGQLANWRILNTAAWLRQQGAELGSYMQVRAVKGREAVAAAIAAAAAAAGMSPGRSAGMAASTSVAQSEAVDGLRKSRGGERSRPWEQAQQGHAVAANRAEAVIYLRVIRMDDAMVANSRAADAAQVIDTTPPTAPDTTTVQHSLQPPHPLLQEPSQPSHVQLTQQTEQVDLGHKRQKREQEDRQERMREREVTREEDQEAGQPKPSALELARPAGGDVLVSVRTPPATLPDPALIRHLHGCGPRGVCLPPLQPGEVRICGVTFAAELGVERLRADWFAQQQQKKKDKKKKKPKQKDLNAAMPEEYIRILLPLQIEEEEDGAGPCANEDVVGVVTPVAAAATTLLEVGKHQLERSEGPENSSEAVAVAVAGTAACNCSSWDGSNSCSSQSAASSGTVHPSTLGPADTNLLHRTQQASGVYHSRTAAFHGAEGLKRQTLIDDLHQKLGLRSGLGLGADPLPEELVESQDVEIRQVSEQAGEAGLFATHHIPRNTVICIIPGYVKAQQPEELDRFKELGYQMLSEASKQQLQRRVAAGGGDADEELFWRFLVGAFGMTFPGCGNVQAACPGLPPLELQMLGYGGLAAYVNDPRVNPWRESESEIAGGDGSPARRSANCTAVPILVQGTPLPVLVAHQDIAPGEELLRDYGNQWWRSIAEWQAVLKMYGASPAAVLHDPGAVSTLPSR
ncbi:hypothetical protein VaNZ11_003452 [Volvox africanus]|uniref:SET domain-containing protein n=1 Tax=Volvox africanus TaxID=51714 RepID=A0ABQ5RU98_9CHLO|nr:hypothetical protein VaNZ11_003452 [Volvox africanus]